jgi:hypothetical protein
MTRLEVTVGSGPRLIPIAAFDMLGAGYSDPGIGLLAFSSYLQISSRSSACFGFKDFTVLENFCQMLLASWVFQLVLLQQRQDLSSTQFCLNVLDISFESFCSFYFRYCHCIFTFMISLSLS